MSSETKVKLWKYFFKWHIIYILCTALKQKPEIICSQLYISRQLKSLNGIHIIGKNIYLLLCLSCLIIDGSAGELVTPNKSRPQVNEESEGGRELYRATHADFLPGEQKHRNYTLGSFDKVCLSCFVVFKEL